MFQWSEAEPGAKVVLNFWPNSRLAVLIKVVLIKKRVDSEDCVILQGDQKLSAPLPGRIWAGLSKNDYITF